MTSRAGTTWQRAVALPIAALAGAALLLAACGSSKTSNPPLTTVPPAAGGSPTTAGSSGSNAAVTVSTATISGVGTVLVNGNGRTLYILASEQGGKVTCTSSGGCTTIWPPAVLPAGMSQGIAGTGAQASLLGSAKSPTGETRLTYGGYPLYTFASDTAAGMASGQGVKDQYGTWWAMGPSGTPIMTSSSSSTTTAPASGGAGF